MFLFYNREIGAGGGDVSVWVWSRRAAVDHCHSGDAVSHPLKCTTETWAWSVMAGAHPGGLGTI